MIQLSAANPAHSTAIDQDPSSARISGKSVFRFADVGTGSGCIALALAKEFSQAEIHATDISPSALEVARANAARLQLDSHIQFHQVDLLKNLTPWFDIIVSNPPTSETGKRIRCN